VCVWRLQEPSESKIWSWVSWDTEPRITVLTRASSKLAACQLVSWDLQLWQLRIRLLRPGRVREPRERRTFAAGSRYQATVSEDWEDFVYSVVTLIYGVCNSVRLSYLFVVTFCKYLINPITNPNPVYRHSITWQYCELHQDSFHSHRFSIVICYLPIVRSCVLLDADSTVKWSVNK
jgi:hypothetical protein